MSRSILILLAVAACDATPDATGGFDEAPPPSGLRVLTTTLVEGDHALATVVGATPGTRVYLGLSGQRGTGPCPGVLGGDCLDLVSPTLLGSSIADASGEVRIGVPSTAGSAGDRVFLQAASATDGISPVRRELVSERIAIAGASDDQFGFGRDVSNRRWNDFGSFDILRFSNAEAWVVALNGPDTFFPGTYSRFDWTTDTNGDAWYCQSAFDASTFGDALGTASSDPTDPALGGCGAPLPGGAPWSRMIPAPLPLTGSYVDEWATAHTISETTWDQGWGLWHVSHWSHTKQFVVARNDVGNSFFPGLWSRFDWTVDPVSGDTYYCQSIFAATAESVAILADDYADPTDLVAGCVGFAWTNLTP